MAIAMAAFTMNDTITKHASQSMSMAQVMVVRGVFATVFVTILAWHQGALRHPALALDKMMWLRVVGEICATVTFLVALSHLPLANVSAVLQALPLAITMGAALFFGEGVGWRRWLAIGVGFLGVTIVIRPGFDGFSVYTLLVLVCVVFCTVRDLSTRRIPREIPALLVSAATASSVTLVGFILLQPMGGWTPPALFETALLALCAVLLLVGTQFIIMAMRIGEISFVAPFRYVALLWAIVLGFVVFGDIPDLPMIVGAAIIVCSGLYTLYRERVVGRSKAITETTGPDMAAPDGL
jgi:drug/metabolite transporter (DMT)-like permease